MAKINIRINSLDSVSPELQAFYQEDEVNGGYVLQADQDSTGLGIGPLSSLRGKLEESQRKENKVKSMLLKKEDDSLWTSEELNAMLSELESLKKSNESLNNQKLGSEDILKQQVAAAKGPIQEENTRLKAENDRFRKSVYDAEGSRLVDKVVKEMNPSPEWEDLMRQELGRHVQVDEVEGSIRSQFIDPSTGTVRFSSERENDGPMNYKEFANLPELRTKYAKCLQGDGKVGANIEDPSRNKNKQASAQQQSGTDVVISKEDASDFAKFVRAAEQAKAQGGQIIIDG
jgi:hypothetical protein